MNNVKWGLLALLLSPVILASCGESEGAENTDAANPAAAVQAYAVVEKEVVGTDTYPASVVPLKEVALRPQVAGYITDIYMEDGAQVTEGQKLYEIDRSKYQAAYQQAEANLQSARANLARVQKDVDRYEALLEKEAIARQQVDYARADLQTAQAQVSSAEAQLRSAATDLEYSIIRAPFSGTVGISQVRIGTQVSPGQPVLNTISSEDPIAVDFVINEQEIPRFTKLRQSKGDSLFKIRLSDGTIYPHPGRLLAIDRAVNRQTGSIIVRLEFPNPERRLVAGMTVNAQVLNQDIGEQIVIPFKAVGQQMGEHFVYVIQGDTVAQRQLQLGTHVNDLVVVREGLQGGERIVVEGLQRLRQGARVEVVNADSE